MKNIKKTNTHALAYRPIGHIIIVYKYRWLKFHFYVHIYILRGSEPNGSSRELNVSAADSVEK